MIKIIKNNTASIVPVNDVGVSIPASGQYIIPPQDFALWASSTEIVTLINAGTLIVNNGTVDYAKIPSIAYLKLEDRLKNVITVSKNPGYGDYSSIAAALASITDSSDINRYLIQVGPGIYTEPILDIPVYTSITGSTIQQTIIQPDSNNHHVFVLNNNCEISFMTIQGAGTGYAGVYCEDSGDYTQLHKVSINSCDLGVWLKTTDTDSYCYLEYVDINGPFTNAILTESINDDISFMNVENFYTYSEGISGTHIFMSGVGAKFNISSSIIEGDSTSIGIYIEDGASLIGKSISINNVHTGIYNHNGTISNLSGVKIEIATANGIGILTHGSSTDSFFSAVSISNSLLSGAGIQVYDGAILTFSAVIVKNFTTGVLVSNTGTAPDLRGNIILLSCTQDIQINHATTTGCISGVMERTKISNAAPTTIQLSYQDPDNGDFNITRTLATRGFATEIREITTVNQTTTILHTDAHVIITTGSTAGQILKLPNATLLREGHQFRIVNEASVSIIVQDYDGTSPITIAAFSNATRILRDDSTSAGVWSSSLAASWLTGKLRDPRTFSMNGTVGDGNWVTISELLPSYKYVFTEAVKLIGIEWSNGNGTGRDFDLVFYKNGILTGNIIRTYQVRNSTYDYGSDVGWTETFTAGDYMRVMYVDQGDNVSDFGGRFNFEVL